MALDFACTSGMRGDKLREAVHNPEDVIAAYERFKREFQPAGEIKTTEEQCKDNGFIFMPMVIEAHGGGWSKSARKVLDSMTKNISATWNEGTETTSLRIAQRLSTTLQRENARAVLRRLHDSGP